MLEFSSLYAQVPHCVGNNDPRVTFWVFVHFWKCAYKRTTHIVLQTDICNAFMFHVKSSKTLTWGSFKVMVVIKTCMCQMLALFCSHYGQVIRVDKVTNLHLGPMYDLQNLIYRYLRYIKLNKKKSGFFLWIVRSNFWFWIQTSGLVTMDVLLFIIYI